MYFRKCAKLEKGEQVIDRIEFSEERNNSLEEWNKRDSNSLVGDCDVGYNHELEGETGE